MSTPSQSPGAEQSRFQRFMTAAPVRIAVLLIVVLWSIPTAGVLISSFRTPAEINTSGWWTALSARTNAEYKTLVERVDRSETFTERTEAQLEEARAALEAGVSAESLSEAIAEAEAELSDAVAGAEADVTEAQEALDNEEEGAQAALEEANAALVAAEAALAAGVDEDAIRASLEAELAEAVDSAEARNTSALERLEEDRAALESADVPEAFPIGSSGWAEQWTFQNYEAVVNAQGMGNAFLNSLLITIPSVVIPITIAAFAAYAFSWMQFPGRDIFFAIVIISMGVPLHLALVPILRMYLGLDLGGTYLGVWLAHTGFGLPLAIYLIYGYMVTIPKDIMESAHIDGASPFTAFTQLILPLSVPVIASFAIFQFLWVWNDLLVALVFLGTESQNAVLTSQLSELVGSKGQDWEVLTAGAFITMIVPLIIFFSLQRYFVRGLMAGSVKG